MKLNGLPVFIHVWVMLCHYCTRSACALIILLLVIFMHGHPLHAQHIALQNPSLEGMQGKGLLPANWYAADNDHTPDVQPGVFDVTLAPSDGKSYVGLHSGPEYMEGIWQELNGVLEEGKAYALSMDLAFTQLYAYHACYGNLAIYGGNALGDTAELLWTSGQFEHIAWRRYNASFIPAKSYKYICLAAYLSTPCTKSPYGVAVLLDNLSPSIQQVLQTEVKVKASCRNAPTGSVAITVKGGEEPYSYAWMPGNYATPDVKDLPAGAYTVKVTAANGVTYEGIVHVAGSDLITSATVTPSSCYGENNNEIAIKATGGIPPYSFYFNDVPVERTVFPQLRPGNYNIVIKDRQVCADTLRVEVAEPPPLKIRHAAVENCSCSEVNNGSIAVQMQGGTPPYRYRTDTEEWQADSVLGNLRAGFYQYEIEDANECAVTGTAAITSPWKNCLVLMPGAFSPNGDGNNDVFRPRIYDDVKNYELNVYNRWGNTVFRSNDPRTGWDGTLNGTVQPVQTYLYFCTFTDRNNERRELRGTVVLVR